MKAFFDEIREQTNLNKFDIVYVLKKAVEYHSRLIIDYQNILEELRIKTNIFERSFHKTQLKNIMGETELNLLTTFKTKEEKEIAIRYSTNELEDLYMNMNKSKDDLSMIEKMIEYLKTTQNNIRTIIDYEKFRSGK